MGFLRTMSKNLGSLGIAALCFGYFASYVPYSMMTKMITKGLFAGMNNVGLSGFQIQPIAVLGSLTGMFTFITLAGWWKYATHSRFLGLSFPRPQWFTFISGLCTAGQIITTTLAYTFDGISIVFAMLLMRGGVLVMAPIIDTVARRRKRRIYWPSWMAAGLSLGALVVAFAGKAGTAMTVIAAIDISLYLFVYFFRLLFMSNRAKSEDMAERRRYFTEEQLVANLVLLSTLFFIGLIGRTMGAESIPAMIWQGTDGKEERLSFGDFSRLSNRFAGAARDLGVKKGDRVMVLMGKLPRWHAVLVGLLKLGAIAIPCAPQLRSGDLQFRAGHSGAVYGGASQYWPGGKARAAYVT